MSAFFKNKKERKFNPILLLERLYVVLFYNKEV